MTSPSLVLIISKWQSHRVSFLHKTKDNCGLPLWLSGKEFACNAGATGDTGSIPESGISPGGKNGNPLQYFCLENPMDRGAWQATVHGVTKSRTRLKQHSRQAHKDKSTSNLIGGIQGVIKVLILKNQNCHGIIYSL